MREAEKLEEFYKSVRQRAQGSTTFEARKRIIVDLYDKFFRNAFPRMTERLGIVYTPIEVVDFILKSVQEIMQKEFGTSLGDPSVHILDPFTGTGTFITRLIQSGMLTKAEIIRKIGANGISPEIHANEIVLLAYYIASINIESATQEVLGGKAVSFNGICLTDTFAMKDGDDLLAEIFPDNSERRKRQNNLDFRVIIGNPPWSVGQRFSSHNNPNMSYPDLESKVSETYVAKSTATNKNSLYDSYKMAIRWATDRIGDQGVIACVTNGSWIDGNADAGIRACLAEEFSKIYVLNLRGNARTSGEQRRTEGGNVFDQGSRAPVVVSIFIRNPKDMIGDCKIMYRDIGDFLTRADKLTKLKTWSSIYGIDNFERLMPDKHHDWIGQRNEAFQDFYPMGSKLAKTGKKDDVVFFSYSRGNETARDAYLYNFSTAACADNAKLMIKDYSNAIKRYRAMPKGDPRKIAKEFSSNLRWNPKLTVKMSHGKEAAHFFSSNIWKIQYRPFVKQHCYIERTFTYSKGQMDKYFPIENIDNYAICISGLGANKLFSALMIGSMPDVQLLSNGQCFPRYRYENQQSNQVEMLYGDTGQYRIDNITDESLQQFKSKCSDSAITKDEIFHFVYGLLHSPDYRTRFANDLIKELPRIPVPSSSRLFHVFASAGKVLSELHLGYENCMEYPLELIQKGLYSEEFKIGKRAMRFADKSRSILILNDEIRLAGIPQEAHEYVVNGRTPLEWFIDRYRVTTDKQSGKVNDPNGWFKNLDEFVAAIRRIVHVSVETTRIVKGLPDLDID